jgi:hypothetical protein
MNMSEDIDQDYFVIVDGNNFYSQNGKYCQLNDNEYQYYTSQGLTESEIKTIIYYQLDNLYSEILSSHPTVSH